MFAWILTSIEEEFAVALSYDRNRANSFQLDLEQALREKEQANLKRSWDERRRLFNPETL